MSYIVKYLIVIFVLVFPFSVSAQESNLYLSEIMAKPEDTTEWVEIYNPTSQTISLDGWKIKDGNNQTSDDLTLSGNIDPQSYKTFEHPKGWLNDSSDETVNLLQDNNIVDSYNYKTTTSGKTFSKINGLWISDTSPSKGSANITIPSSPSPTPSSTPIPSTKAPTSVFSLTQIPEKIFSVDIITTSIQLDISSSPNTLFYLKPSFKKLDSTNYFGLSKVGDEWIKNSETYSKQFKITTDSQGVWSGKIDVKVDPFDSGYDGGGRYVLKVARYSEDGIGPVWSNEYILNIEATEIEPVLSDQENFIIPSFKHSPSPTLKPAKDPEIPKEVYALENYQKRISSKSAISTVSGVSINNNTHQLSYKKTEYLPMILGGVFLLIGLIVYFHIKSNGEDENYKN